jgi:iron complex transport system ATP-binding protein
VISAKLEVDNATFSYDGSTPIFEDISFEVNKGEVFCILGPNGTGKSTLLRCLCNIHKLRGGSIRIDGQDISALKPAHLARRIGFIPQIHTPTFPYTVLEVVLMGRAPHLNMIATPSEKDYRIAEQAIKTINIEHIMDKPYTQLSGGQMQLVLLARVLAQEPDILLLDEPTSQLDIGNQMRTIAIIRKLANDGLSLVVTSHFPDHAFLYADKVGILKDKTFIKTGDTETTVTEKNLTRAYGVDVRIIHVGDGINRKLVVPMVTPISEFPE